MSCRPRAVILLALLAAAAPAIGQTPAPPVPANPEAAVSPAPLAAAPTPLALPRLKKVKRPAPARNLPMKATRASARPGAASGTWVRLNTHLLGSVGESTWVNLAQATNIRFYRTGTTTFAAVGGGGSSYVSTSDPAEIQKLRAYVLAHQAR